MGTIRGAMMLWAFGAIGSVQAAPAPENSITVVVLDGPFAGSYTAGNTACLHVKDRNTLGCGWKEFADHPKTKTLEEVGLQVDTVSTGPGAKTGDVIVRFLDGISPNMQDYSVSNVPMTLTRTGAIQVISFDGKTKNGVHLRVTETIVEVDEF